jgi:purine catabolism regulator
MALLRSATGDDLAARRRRLLDDLVLERFSSVGDLVARCRVLGLAFAAGADYLALLVRGLPVDDLPHAARAIEHALAPAPALVAELGNDVVAITTSATDPARAVLAAIEPRRPPSSVRIVVGPPASLTTISRSVSDARAALDLADRLNLVEPCLAAASLTPQILLSELINHPSARRLVDDQLGPLLEHDQLRDTSLTRTLRTYLAHGSNKVAAARALHVRRQTMYQRLARIVELIGDIQLPHRHTGLVVALELAALTERATGAKSRPTQSVPTATPGPPARSPGAGRDDQA